MARLLKENGKGIITAPTSFGVVFTSGVGPKEKVIEDIHEQIRQIGDSQDATEIKEHLNTLSSVYRATFAFRDGKLTLITDESNLVSGEKIWRKLPGLNVPNVYHAESEYEAALVSAELRVIQKHREFFKNNKEWKLFDYDTLLGV